MSPTDVCVKTGKALTLFMIDTLVENTRKYIPKGRTIKIYAHKENDYVEISVEDNGHGLSSEDVAHIIEEKIYDSKVIGMNDAPNREELWKKKGSGFGLTSCKGIIEEYKKTNPIFNIYLFNMESTLRKGGRLYSRLPVGVRKTITAALFVLPLNVVSCSRTANNDMSQEVPADSLISAFQGEYEFLLDQASDYTDDAYYCNIEGEYAMALQYIDSAMMCLNEYYGRYVEKPHCYMTLTGNDVPAELDW